MARIVWERWQSVVKVQFQSVRLSRECKRIADSNCSGDFQRQLQEPIARTPGSVGPVGSRLGYLARFRDRISRPNAYRMNNISRYVGSGQSSSLTIVSSLSPALRVSSMAG